MTEVATYVKFEELPETVRFNIIADVLDCFWHKHNIAFNFSVKCVEHVENMYFRHTIVIWRYAKWIKEITEFAKGWRFRVIPHDNNEELFVVCNLKFGYHLGAYKI